MSKKTADKPGPDKKWTKAEYARCKDDFIYWAENWVLIRAKATQGDDKIKWVDFKLNPAQKKLHEFAEDQLRRTGKVRIVEPKGRQLGSTTYIALRIMHRCIFSEEGVDAAFMADTDKGMERIRRLRYEDVYKHLKCKVPPMTGSARTKKIRNSTIEMTYASGSEPLRGSTVDILHLSEAGFYDKEVKDGGDEVAAAALTTVPNTPGTEIWIESTCVGAAGSFYKWIKGCPTNGFECIFLKTSLDPTYELRPLPPEFTMTKMEEKYAKRHDLNIYHMAWRRSEKSMKSEIRFMREYPETLDEALSVADTGALIDPVLVNRATASLAPHGGLRPSNLPIILGIDVGMVKDRTVVCVKQGHIVHGWYYIDPLDFDRQAAQVHKIFGDFNATFAMPDAGGAGHEFCNVLSKYIGNACLPVIPGGKADNQHDYLNRRAEMWDRARVWFESEDPEPVIYCREERIRDRFVEAMVLHTYKHKEGTNQLQMVDKGVVRKKMGGTSPDEVDAFINTFGHEQPAVINQDGDLSMAPTSSRVVPSFGGYGGGRRRGNLYAH